MHNHIRHANARELLFRRASDAHQYLTATAVAPREVAALGMREVKQQHILVYADAPWSTPKWHAWRSKTRQNSKHRGDIFGATECDHTILRFELSI